MRIGHNRKNIKRKGGGSSKRSWPGGEGAFSREGKPPPRNIKTHTIHKEVGELPLRLRKEKRHDQGKGKRSIPKK